MVRSDAIEMALADEQTVRRANRLLKFDREFP